MNELNELAEEWWCSHATTSDAPVETVFGRVEWQSCQGWCRLACAVSGEITEDVLHVQSLLLNKARGAVNTPFLSKLLPLLASFFIALSLMPGLHLLFAMKLKTNLASLAFSFGVIWLVKLG